MWGGRDAQVLGEEPLHPAPNLTSRSRSKALLSQRGARGSTELGTVVPAAGGSWLPLSPWRPRLCRRDNVGRFPSPAGTALSRSRGLRVTQDISAPHTLPL